MEILYQNYRGTGEHYGKERFLPNNEGVLRFLCHPGYNSCVTHSNSTFLCSFVLFRLPGWRGPANVRIILTALDFDEILSGSRICYQCRGRSWREIGRRRFQNGSFSERNVDRFECDRFDMKLSLRPVCVRYLGSQWLSFDHQYRILNLTVGGREEKCSAKTLTFYYVLLHRWRRVVFKTNEMK